MPCALLFLLLITTSRLAAQTRGEVFDTDDYPLVGATVRWADGTGTTVDADGRFILPAAAGQDRFSISYLGFATREFWTDTLQFPLTVILAEEGTLLGEVQVTARDAGNSASLVATRNLESITSKELRKAPCCSLAESFENSPVVDLTYGDPLTGRREIQLLGLRGNYTQLTLEKRPMLDGLATPFALDLVPGPWVSGIQIGKGSGSLESGAAGLTGEINTELIKPTDGPKAYLNLFAGSQGRGEVNALANRQVGKTLWLGGMGHGSFTNNELDHDGDGFKDMPDRRTAVGLLRLFRQGNDNWEGQWNVLGVSDRRTAGQLTETDPYLIEQDNRRLEAWGKTGYFGFAKPHRSVGLIYSGSYHELNNRYGAKRHVGEQRSGYLNALYHTRIGNDSHLLSLGGTVRSDDFREVLDSVDYGRMERTVGAYGEYTFSWEEASADMNRKSLTAILGLRADHHNLGGTQLSPRLNVKFKPNELTVVRLSAGRGWRSPNLLVDNLNWLPSSRTLTDRPGATDEEPAGPNPGFRGLETAWNYGFNITRGFILGGRAGQLVVDAFRTDFEDQLIVDAEQDLQTLRIYQLEGSSFANSLIVSANYEVLRLLDVKVAYKYNDARQTYADGGLRQVPLTALHRVLTTVGYDGARFKAHLNYHWTGEQRLITNEKSPTFGLLNAQLTYVIKDGLEIYGGGENLTSVTQRNAITGAADPFGGYFDATQVYQPLFQRQAYLGFRWELGKD